MLPPQQVQHMCWICELTRHGTGTLRPRWKNVFLTFKGTDVLLFDTPPVSNITITVYCLLILVLALVATAFIHNSLMSIYVHV